MLNLPSDYIIETTDPGKQSGRIPLDVAESLLKVHIEAMKDDAIAWWAQRATILSLPPHSAVKITTGAGKSHVMRDAAVGYVQKAECNKRAVFLVSTHKLGNEALEKMPAGVTPALLQSRKSKSVITGEPMCRNPDAVEAAEKIGADVEKTACKNGIDPGAIKCPFYHTCEYQAQMKAAKKADVIFAAHEYGFQPPKLLRKGFGLVVIDEGFWQDGITEANFVIAGLDHALGKDEFPVLDYGDRYNPDETADLRYLIETLQGALASLPDGYVTKSALLDAGLSPRDGDERSSCAKARKYEWARMVDTGLRPGADDAKRKAVLEKFRFLGQIPGRAAMWHALDDLLCGDDETTGRLKIWTHNTDDGPVRKLRVRGHKPIHETLESLPIMHLDATMPIDIVRHYLRRIELSVDIDVDAPHQKIVQIIGTSTGKSALEPRRAGERSPDEEERVGRKVGKYVDFVRIKAAGGKKVLVITYKSIEHRFAGIDGVETGHFGALEGIDRWKDVDCVVIIGRPLPNGRDIEKYVCALTGEPVTIDDDSTIETEAYIQMRDGTTRPLKTRVYENPHAEIVRRAVVEAAIIQAIGRGRGVRRGAGNPLEVFMILHDTVVTGLPVDEVIDWADEKPDRIDEMFLRGLVPQFPADAARIYGNGSSLGELFKTRKAAVRAYQNAGFKMQLSSEGEVVPKPLYILLIRKWALPPRGVRYQPTGKGQQSRFALFNPEKFPDIRAALEKALGPQAAFEIIPAPEPGPTGPEPEASPPLAPDPDDPGITVRRYPKLSPKIICQQIQWFGRNKVPYLSRAGVQAGAAHA